jgi:hypothetical protein
VSNDLREQVGCFEAKDNKQLEAFERFAENQWRDHSEVAAGILILAACK